MKRDVGYATLIARQGLCRVSKYTSADIGRIAERLRSARDGNLPAHFLIGAGCSITAGIPSAARLIEEIHSRYPVHCKDLKDENRHSYGACMALLSRNERRALIRPYLENAKINWGTIALAQLIVENYVGRVLTVNFDLVLENACGLLGLQPAVYDFGVAPINDPTRIVSPSIIHLHGQSYGLVLLNTDEETRKHREKLRPILSDTLRNAALVVVGYSGSADGIFKTLLDEFESNDRLYWASYEEEPHDHIRPFLEKDHFHFIGGTDFDRFMIELAQSLGCWPPGLFANPLKHLLEELRPVVDYPVVRSDSAVDILGELRRKLESWQQKLNGEEDSSGQLQELYMKGDFQKAAQLFSTRFNPETASDEDRDIASWSFMGWGNLLTEQAERVTGEQGAQLVAQAGEQYRIAVALKPNRHEAWYNWGNLLLEQGERTSGAEAKQLFEGAIEKYQKALEIEPSKENALCNWGVALSKLAEQASDEKVEDLCRSAAEKYKMALEIKPYDHETLCNWGNLLAIQAKRATSEVATRLFSEATEKYQAALAIKRDDSETFKSWGTMLLDQAKRASPDEARRLFAEAEQKMKVAAKTDPTTIYNIACLAALQGNEGKCRKNLEQAEKSGALPDIEHLNTDTDLDSVRDKPWFQQLLRRKQERLELD